MVPTLTKSEMSTNTNTKLRRSNRLASSEGGIVSAMASTPPTRNNKTPSKKPSAKRNKKSQDGSPGSVVGKRKEKLVVLAPVKGADKQERYKAALQGATQWQLTLADGNGATTLTICRTKGEGEITFGGIIETLQKIGTDDELEDSDVKKNSFGKWTLQPIVALQYKLTTNYAPIFKFRRLLRRCSSSG